ncbi:MAG: NUDIX domain-containing protein [Minicystis sp.]
MTSPLRAEPGAVAVVIRHGERFAAIRAVQRGRKVGFVAGHIDPGESVEVAAIREAKEEAGLDVTGVRILGERRAGTLICALTVAESWSGELRSSAEGEVFWATRDDLVGTESAYPDWNAWALECLGESFP